MNAKVRLSVACVVVSIAGLVLFGAGRYLKGEPPQEKKVAEGPAKEGENPEASRFLEAPPDLRASSSVSFKQDGRELRVVGISPQMKTSKNYVKGLRFHKILGALAERDTPIEEGMPNIIDDISREPDGSAWLRFRVIVTTPEFQRRCRDAVLDQERELLREEGLTQDDIRIEPWPLKHCVVSVQNSFSKEIIAVSQTGSLTGTKDEFNFTMHFSPEELRKVLGLIGKGKIEFVYSYSYVGSTEYQGSVDLKGVKKAKLIASQKLRSEQVEGKEPIFQAEANEAIRHLCLSVQKTVRVGHKDLIPLLDQPDLLQKLFVDDGEITFKDLKEGDEKTALMLAGYLKPHLEQVRESFGGEKSDITIHEDKSGKAETSGSDVKGSVGATLPLPIPISLSFGGGLSSSTTKTNEVLDRIQQATGSKWALDKATERFRPHSIKKLKFQSGADQVLIDEKTTVFLSVGPENRYLEDTPIPVTFTSKVAGLSTSPARGSDLGPYEGVPIGAMIPFFGTKLPKGYVWADGQTTFDPKAAWLPVHLRGAKVPDMQECLVGGAKDEANVGIVYDKGKVTVPAVTINGSSFKLPAERSEAIQIAAGEGSCGKGGFVGVFNPNDNYKSLKDGVFWGGYGGQFDSRAAIYKSFKTSEGLQGDQKVNAVEFSLKNRETFPSHVMCRWIIRVE